MRRQVGKKGDRLQHHSPTLDPATLIPTTSYRKGSSHPHSNVRVRNHQESPVSSVSDPCQALGVWRPWHECLAGFSMGRAHGWLESNCRNPHHLAWSWVRVFWLKFMHLLGLGRACIGQVCCFSMSRVYKQASYNVQMSSKVKEKTA